VSAITHSIWNTFTNYIELFVICFVVDVAFKILISDLAYYCFYLTLADFCVFFYMYVMYAAAAVA